jgi:hypothetical protein
MELVFIILAVTLLIVLPIAFFLLAIGGLFYGLFRAIRGEKEQPATPVMAPGPARYRRSSRQGRLSAREQGCLKALVERGVPGCWR